MLRKTNRVLITWFLQAIQSSYVETICSKVLWLIACYPVSCSNQWVVLVHELEGASSFTRLLPSLCKPWKFRESSLEVLWNRIERSDWPLNLFETILGSFSRSHLRSFSWFIDIDLSLLRVIYHRMIYCEGEESPSSRLLAVGRFVVRMLWKWQKKSRTNHLLRDLPGGTRGLHWLGTG